MFASILYMQYFAGSYICTIVPFKSDFFPLAVSSLNNANQLIRYNNQLTVVDQCFTNIAAIQNMGLLQQI